MPNSMLLKRTLLLVVLPVLLALPTCGQESDKETEKLAKDTQNPVASLISVPLQNNTNFSIGPYGRDQNVLNIQPVVPVRVSENWNLIIRAITPIIYQPDYTQANNGTFGLGDMYPTFFLSPAHPHKLVWGVGPAFVLPTATNQVLGQGKFSIGPSLVGLVQPGHWTVGILTSNVWSVAGSSSRANVNQMLLQYFITYNLKKGWYLTMSPIVTADWMAPSGSRWTVPVGGGVGRIFRMGFQPVNVSVQFYGNAVYPTGGSPWSMRTQIAFLFPKKK